MVELTSTTAMNNLILRKFFINFFFTSTSTYLINLFLSFIITNVYYLNSKLLLDIHISGRNTKEYDIRKGRGVEYV